MRRPTRRRRSVVRNRTSMHRPEHPPCSAKRTMMDRPGRRVHFPATERPGGSHFDSDGEDFYEIARRSLRLGGRSGRSRSLILDGRRVRRRQREARTRPPRPRRSAFKFGLAGPLTGQYANYGTALKKAPRSPSTNLNAAGGVNGGHGLLPSRRRPGRPQAGCPRGPAVHRRQGASSSSMATCSPALPLLPARNTRRPACR